MDKQKILYDITAYVDNEIPSGEHKADISRLIESDPYLRKEYLLQLRMKQLVVKHKNWVATPDNVKQRILKQTTRKKSFSLFDFFLFQPAYSVSLVIAGILLLIGFSITGENIEFKAFERGNNNIYVQAGSNFNKIIEGKLAPQLITDDPNAVKNFFVRSGVKYNTVLPDLPSWKILGCVVSDEGGNKFAHHVYINENGKLLYVYQADKKYFSGKKVLSISPVMLQKISSGKHYFESKDGYNIMLTKIGSNIFAFVSNEKEEKVKNCLTNYLTKVKI